MVVPVVHASAAVPSPQLTVRVIWPTGPSSVSAVWVMVPAGASEEELHATALASPQFASHLDAVDVVKVVVAAGRLVNIVVKPMK